MVDEYFAQHPKAVKLFWEESLIGFAIVNKEGNFLYVNAALCDLLGYNKEELLSKKFQEITHRDDLLADETMANKVAEGEESSYTMIKRYLTKTYGVIWVKLKVTGVYADDGVFEVFFTQVQPPLEYFYSGNNPLVDISKPTPALEGKKTFLKENTKWVAGFFAGVGLVIGGGLMGDMSIKSLGEVLLLGSLGGYQWQKELKQVNKPKDS